MVRSRTATLVADGHQSWSPEHLSSGLEQLDMCLCVLTLEFEIFDRFSLDFVQTFLSMLQCTSLLPRGIQPYFPRLWRDCSLKLCFFWTLNYNFGENSSLYPILWYEQRIFQLIKYKEECFSASYSCMLPNVDYRFDLIWQKSLVDTNLLKLKHGNSLHSRQCVSLNITMK